ncbi:MAG: hypothetical protein [Siphoviridae sp. cttb18]|nr:MAG: hypothetical protein [Siphoviridae sp. cttb18]
MAPLAKEVAKMSNEVLSVGRRLRNLAKRLNSEHAMSRELLEKGLQELRERNF